MALPDSCVRVICDAPELGSSCSWLLLGLIGVKPPLLESQEGEALHTTKITLFQEYYYASPIFYKKKPP